MGLVRAAVRRARVRWEQAGDEERQEAAEDAARAWFAYYVERGAFNGVEAWLIAADRRLLAATPTFLGSLGVDLPTFLGWPAEAIIPPDQRSLLIDHWPGMLDLGYAEGEFELWANDRRIGRRYARMAVNMPLPGTVLNVVDPTGRDPDVTVTSDPRVIAGS